MIINIHKQNNSLLIHFVSLTMIMLLAGCSSIQVGRYFDIQTFENIVKIGETTKAQVLDKMGSPKSTGVSINKDGERLFQWIYFYASGQLPAMDDAQLKILQIQFDQSGIVRSYNWTNSDN